MAINSINGNTLLETGIFPPCRAATTAEIVLAGLQTIDGVVLIEGDRVLVKDQTNQKTNGIYAAQTGNWLRTTDAHSSSQFFNGMAVIVAQGALSAGITYLCTAIDDPVIIGTSLLTFDLQSVVAAGSLLATSATAQTIGAGSMTFTTQRGKPFVPGGFVTIASRANPLNYMTALITAYSGTALTVYSLVPSGSGSHSDWNIAVAGAPGPQGLAGSPQLIDTRAIAIATTIPSSVNFLRTAGYSTIGDFGGALYKKVGGATTGGFQSLDGAWWQIVERVVNPHMFGAKGDGVTDDAAALQAAEDVAGAAGGGQIVDLVGSLTYVIGTAIARRAGVRLNLNGATVIKKAASNITRMFDCTTYAANRSSIAGPGIIDGARATNTDNLLGAIIEVYVGTADDVSVTGINFQHSCGSFVIVTTGKNPNIKNTYTDFVWIGVGVLTGVNGTKNHAEIEDNTFNFPFGYHCIKTLGSDYAKIRRNTVNGDFIGGVGAVLTINSTGNTVTWVSGPNFTNAKVGMFVFTATGEFLIDQVVSSSQLHLRDTIGTLSSVAAVVGPGDAINVDGCSYFMCDENDVTNGSIVLTNEGDGSAPGNVFKGQVLGNKVNRSVGNGISVQAVTNGYTIQDLVIEDNPIVDSGLGGAAVSAANKAAIALIDFSAAGNITNTVLNGNYVRDNNFTGGTINYWLYLSGISAGQVLVGANAQVGCANPGIFGGVSSISLSNWGAGAAVSAIVWNGRSGSFTVTAGSGPGSFPQLTINTVATTMENPPAPMASVGFHGTGSPALIGLAAAPAPTSIVLEYNGTPTNGLTYKFNVVM